MSALVTTRQTDVRESMTSSRLMLSMVFALALVVSAVASLNLALPDIARATGADQTQLQWIVDGYAVVFAGLLLPGSVRRPGRTPSSTRAGLGRLWCGVRRRGGGDRSHPPDPVSRLRRNRRGARDAVDTVDRHECIHRRPACKRRRDVGRRRWWRCRDRVAPVGSAARDRRLALGLRRECDLGRRGNRPRRDLGARVERPGARCERPGGCRAVGGRVVRGGVRDHRRSATWMDRRAGDGRLCGRCARARRLSVLGVAAGESALGPAPVPGRGLCRRQLVDLAAVPRLLRLRLHRVAVPAAGSRLLTASSRGSRWCRWRLRSARSHARSRRD